MKLIDRLFPRRGLPKASSSLAALVGQPVAIKGDELRARFLEALRREREAGETDRLRAMHAEDEGALPMEIVDGIARIRIDGLLLPSGAAWWRYWGLRATDYQEITAMAVMAQDDANVRSIMLDVDSPGGYVRGITSAVDAIWEAGKKKPVHAHTGGLMASCAYHLGSQAQRISADRNALVGCIGEMVILVDASKHLKEEGIEVVVIASGAHKGVGVWGAEITAEQRAALQELVGDGHELFLRDVLRSRLDLTRRRLASVADGRSFYAERAEKVGLIDDVETDHQALDACMVARLEDGGSGADEPPNDDETEDPEVDTTETEESKPAGAAGDQPAPSAQKGDAMSNPKPAVAPPAASPPPATLGPTELEQARKQLEEERAKRETAEAQVMRLQGEKELAELALGSHRADRIKAILDEFQGAGRFDPAVRPKMEEVARKTYSEDPEALRTYLDSILPATRNREQPKGTAVPPSAGSAASLTAEEAMAAKALGLSPEEVELGQRVKRVDFTRNKLTLTDGTEMPLVKKEG